jgi:sialate O-acetylesterase
MGLAACLLGAWPARADLSLSALWSDHAVIQAGAPVVVFGHAEPGTAVTVRLAGHRGQATADDAGGWRVELPALAATHTPQTLTAEAAGQTRRVEDLLVGEVWLCSGQSNMFWPVSKSTGGAEAIAASARPALRLFTVGRGTSDRPRVTVAGQWGVAGPETVGDFSAVAYHFGLALQQELGVPVGLIHASFSGSPIEAWVSRPSLERAPSFGPVRQRWEAALANWDQSVARSRFERKKAEYDRRRAEGTLEPVHGRPPRPPAFRDLPTLIHRPANLYHHMIAPLTAYPIRGVVWYQGEANARSAAAYADWLETLIADWRAAWDAPQMPFLGVQIPNFAPKQTRPMDSWWAELRDAQARALDAPNTALAVTLDLGDAKDIHPPQKGEVGRRLSLLALRDVYGRPVAASGPRFAALRLEGDTAVVSFDHADALRTTDGGPVQGFAIAGRDHRWHWAEAVIEGSTVRLRSDDVPEPLAVRYAWASNPDINLTNATGLPAAPFRTDDRPRVTEGELWLPWLDEAEAQMTGLHLPQLFGDHMVLQHGMDLPIWGSAEPGQAIEVRLADQTLRAVADADGRWRVEAAPLAPSSDPITLTVTAAPTAATSGGGGGGEDETIEIRDVLVGEVWLCSGQSNMQWPVSRSNDPEATAAGADHPRIRLMTIAEAAATEPRRDVVGRWEVCTPQTVKEFSAVGYHFGRSLLDRLDMPIGLIDHALGGTRAEAWTSRSALEAEPALRPLLEKWDRYVEAWDAPTQRALYERRRAAWLPTYHAARAAGERPPRGPRLDSRRPDSRDRPANLYRGVVAPLAGFPLRGVIWYQGESNANRGVQYRTLFPTMIRDWRERWGRPQMPFLFVQIAGWGPIATEPEDHERAELRDAQTAALDLPQTAMVTALDVGEVDVHPKDKQTVGRRLAAAARRLVYGDDVVAHGPTFRDVTFDAGHARVRFDHTHGGLVTPGDTLPGFALAGADRRFHWADARIDGDTVVLESDAVPEPVAVRYGWAGHPRVNLYNRAGWPALPFRTDDWPLLSQDTHGPWD